MSDAERVALSPSDPEYQSRYVAGGLWHEARSEMLMVVSDVNRVIGSKIQVAGWTTYSLLIGFLKLSVLAFYIRLTVRVLSRLRPSTCLPLRRQIF